MKRIFFDYGIEICINEGRYYLIFDDGGIVSHSANIEITKEHAEKAMKSSSNASAVILHYKRIEDQQRQSK